MAVKHVKDYLYTIQQQYIEMKADLADMEEALKAGFITEDKLATVKENVEILETNYNRIAYINYLLDMPARKAKEPKYNKQNKKQLEKFIAENATKEAVVEENTNALKIIKEEKEKLAK
jgi:hypothetical protein